MVHLTGAQLGVLKTFGLKVKGKVFNHRVPIKYQRFQVGLNPEEIVAHYSRDDIDTINPRAGMRTYKDAQHSLGRKNFLLPNLGAQDLEINELFQREFDRQRAMVARVDKIRVVIVSKPGHGTALEVKKNISTPNDCAKQINQLLVNRTAVAELLPLETEQDEAPPKPSEDELIDEALGIDSEKNQSVVKTRLRPESVYWDMNRPLVKDCRIAFRHFAEDNLSEVNKIYWRSCSFVLGMAVRLAFKDEIKVILHSWPKPDIKSGSFVYDVALNLSEKWQPTEQELRAFTKVMWNIKNAGLPFDRIEVSRDVARRLFHANPFKLSQIESILENESSKGKVTVYRCGGLLDMSVGPMIANTGHIGRVSLAAVHPFESSKDDHKGVFYRFQGVSIPQQLPISSYLYQNVLLDRARQLNKSSL